MSNDPAFRTPLSDSNSRVPPHNVDAEASLLGAMLLSRDAIGPAVETRGGDQFYVPAHGYIFTQCLFMEQVNLLTRNRQKS